MPECEFCKYRFHKELKGKTTIITLIETKTRKEMGYVIFEIKSEYIELEYIVANERKKGFGSKLVRVVKAIAKGVNKPIYIDAFNNAVGFWENHNFMVLGESGSYSELVRMGWKP